MSADLLLTTAGHIVTLGAELDEFCGSPRGAMSIRCVRRGRYIAAWGGHTSKPAARITVEGENLNEAVHDLEAALRRRVEELRAELEVAS